MKLKDLLKGRDKLRKYDELKKMERHILVYLSHKQLEWLRQNNS